VNGENTAYTFRCDALAVDTGRVFIASVVAPETAAKALVAVLRTTNKVRMNAFNCSPISSYRDLAGHEDGYRVYRQRLEYDNWHILAVAKSELLLPEVSEDCLWQQLRSERFTTPLLRSWLPWLMERLLDLDYEGGIKRIECFGCSAGVLLADTEKIDKLVLQGLNDGSLNIRWRRVTAKEIESHNTGDTLHAE
jgi:hypothetical protein